MGKITSYKDFKNNVQSIRDELTKQGYTPRSVPSEQKEETQRKSKRARVYSKKPANRVLMIYLKFKNYKTNIKKQKIGDFTITQ